MKALLPVLLILISIAAFILVVNPIYKEVSAMRTDIVVYDEALNNSTNLQKTEDSLIKSYNEIKQEDKDRLSKFLPSAVNNIQFILEVERIANMHNMPIRDIKFEAVKKDTVTPETNTIVYKAEIDNRLYRVFPIEFTTDATYDNFVLFLKDLEYNLRLVDVKSISFVVPNQNVKGIEGVDPNIYHFILKVETYWLK